MVGAGGEFSTGAAERSGGDRLALTAVGASPHGPIHALEGEQAATGVAYGDVHLGADLVRLLDCARNDTVGIC